MPEVAALTRRFDSADERREFTLGHMDVVHVGGITLGRAEYARVVRLIEQTPEVINAFNVTGEDSWILEIAVIDVEHLDAVVTKFCILTETSTSIVLNMPRENAVVLPARRENIKPAIRKVTGR